MTVSFTVNQQAGSASSFSPPSVQHFVGVKADGTVVNETIDVKQLEDQAAAQDIAGDAKVPAAITAQLRDLDKLARKIGSDGNPNAHYLDGSPNTPIEPQLQKGLAALNASVLQYTRTLNDQDRAAVAAYVARQLTNINNVVKEQQDAGQYAARIEAQQAAKGSQLQVLPNGKTQAQNFADSAAAGLSDISAAANKLLAGQGLGSSAVADLLQSFGDVSYSATRKAEQQQVDNGTYQQQLDRLPDALAKAQADQTSAFGQSFLTALVKGFGTDLASSLQSSKQQLADLIKTTADSNAVDQLKSELSQYDAKFQATSQTISSLLSQLAGKPNQNLSNNTRGALFSSQV